MGMDNSSSAVVPERTRDPLFVIGIGASAGGLEALEEFFANTPSDSGMAYVVIQHLSPDFKSVMDQLLARKTDLPICLIEDDMEVEPDTIYLLPPKKEAILADRKLLLADRPSDELLSFPIDHFFRSLAQDAGRYAVAVVLSGTGSDGSRGILDVHAAGGLVIAQSDTSAKFDGMPRSACDTGVVDMVLPPREVPSALQRFVENPLSHHQRAATELTGHMEGSLLSILTRLKEQYGLDFTNYKTTTISRRIERRLMLTGTQELEEYAARISKDDSELDRLYRDLLIGVTGFFRDKEVFERLELDVIPDLLTRLSPDEELRAWVAACATGEEAYSLAILLAERLDADGDNRPVRIFASDVHQQSLNFAGRGVYQRESLAGATTERLQRYFIERSDGFHVSPELRKMVVFTHHNVIRDAPFTKLDLITCRNMLIYLTQPAQKKALSLFHFGLKRNGALCLGTSETPGDLADEFEPIEERTRIYRKHRDVKLPASLRLPISAPVAPTPSAQEFVPALTSTVPGRSLLNTYDQLLDRFMPPGILISKRRVLLHSFPGASKYLRHRDGRPSTDVLDLVLPDLRPSFSAALRRVQKEGKAVSYAGIDCATSEGPAQVRLTVWPLASKEGYEHLLVQFECEEPRLRVAEADEIDAGEISSEDIEALERELQYTKDSLQSTIEELQTTNEEFQSANEQLTSSNEELQSTNEELHSVNEELYTVNAEHQRKIDELTELTDDMDNLLNSTNVHTVFLDRDFCIRRFTPGIADTFSLIPQDVGRRFDSFSNKIVYDGLNAEVERVLKTGEPFEREVTDKRDMWYLLRIRPYVARGEIEGVVVTLIDITTTKKAQAQIEQMSEIVEHSDDAIYRVDLDGTIRTWNLGANKLYGYEGSQAIGNHVSFLAPDDRPSEPGTYLDRIRNGSSVDHVETTRKRRNGTSVDVSLTVSPIRDHLGEIVGASVIARDITKQKQAESEIRDAVRHRDQFLAMLSHELRNPLAAILNATSLLREDALDDESASEAREVVEHQLHHVARLLDDLLDVARVTNGKLVLKTEVIDLERLMMDVVDCVQYQVDEKSQQLHVQAPDEPLYVAGDLGRLQQAQVNLLMNSSKYSRPERSIWYSLSRDGDEAVITVRDEGEGIPASLLPTIFEPFVQADQTIDRAQGGMGLGLPLVRMIATAHSGSVVAHSSGPGRGSDFTIRLPLTAKLPAEKLMAQSVAPVGDRLLLIEDNDGIRRMLARSLELKGFEVATASNGLDGLDVLQDFQPDVAIVDIGLPDINGYELARRIRAQPEFSGLVLVAVTGYGREEDRAKSNRSGFDLHLVKPINPNELVHAVGSLNKLKLESDESAENL